MTGIDRDLQNIRNILVNSRNNQTQGGTRSEGPDSPNTCREGLALAQTSLQLCRICMSNVEEPVRLMPAIT